MSNQFYVTCPSNSSMDIYPNNTLTNFTTKLNVPLELDGDYEVGLSEIQYPLSWYNVRPRFNYIVIRKEGAKVGSRKNMVQNVVNVKPGYYKTIESLVHEINSKISLSCTPSSDPGNIVVEYDSITRRVTITTDKSSIQLRNDIARLLGFEHNTVIKRLSKVTGAYPATPSGGFHAMYVYLDAIQEQFVGDFTAPLLRIVNVINRNQEEIVHSETFNKIYYLPVSKRYISTLEVRIADDSGESVAFKEGKVILILHFRRIK